MFAVLNLGFWMSLLLSDFKTHWRLQTHTGFLQCFSKRLAASPNRPEPQTNSANYLAPESHLFPHKCLSSSIIIWKTVLLCLSGIVWWSFKIRLLKSFRYDGKERAQRYPGQTKVKWGIKWQRLPIARWALLWLLDIDRQIARQIDKM